MSAVILATHHGDVLRIWLHTDSDELVPLSQSRLDHELDPNRLAKLIADLAGEFAWLGNGAAATGKTGEVLRSRPVAAVAPTKPKPTKPRRATARSKERIEARRVEILRRVDAAGTVSSGELLDIYDDGDTSSASAKVFGDIYPLVKSGALERIGMPGSYRWRRPTGEDA